MEEETGAAVAGAQCNRYAVLESPETKQRRLIWTFSHAIVDTAFQERIHAKGSYSLRRWGEITHSPEADTLASHLLRDPDGVTRFWQQYFDSLDASAFPTLPSYLTVPHPRAQAEHRISWPGSAQRRWPSMMLVEQRWQCS